MRGWLLPIVGAAIAACVLPSKTIDDSPTVFASDVFGRGGTCEACLASSCIDEGNACGADYKCRDRLACITRCSQQPYFSPVCHDACVRDNPTDGALDGALFSCAGTFCRKECGIGSDFRCAGQYAWPTPAATSVNVSMQIVRALENAPIAQGASVIACTADDTRCDFTTDGTSRVDGDGVATFRVPTVNTFGNREAWRGYLRLEEARDKPDPVAPSLFFQSRREYRDRAAFQAPFATAKEVAIAYDVGLKTTPDPTKGTVVGAIYECRTFPPFFADGVTVSVEGLGIAPLYVAGRSPEPTLHATDKSGGFFLPNVPAGTHAFAFKRGGVEIARESMVVKAGTVTVLGVWPSTK